MLYLLNFSIMSFISLTMYACFEILDEFVESSDFQDLYIDVHITYQCIFCSSPPPEEPQYENWSECNVQNKFSKLHNLKN